MNERFYDNLTTSAKKELETSVQEISDLLVYKAHLNAKKRNTADEEISLSDILSAKNEILTQKYISTKKRNTSRQRLLLLSLVGFLYAFLGIGLYLFQNYSFNKEDIGLVIAVLGVFISIIPVFYAKMSITKENEKIIREYEYLDNYFCDYTIIQRWQTIEKMGMDLMINQGVSKKQSYSIHNLVQFLSANIKGVSLSELKQLLSTRNEIVHKGKKLTRFEFEQVLEIAERIISELKDKLWDRK